MKVIAACITLLVALFAAQQPQLATAAVATGNNNYVPHVGLYAPDRYDGIPEMCLMPMDFGYCRAKVKRYYFDMRRMKCTMFYFGGCAGNINNFKSLDECNKICIDSYEYETEDDNPNIRNYINKNTIKNNNDNNNNNSRTNASTSNKNNNSNKENSSSSNYKNSSRRSSDNAGSNEEKENVENDSNDYTNN